MQDQILQLFAEKCAVEGVCSEKEMTVHPTKC